MKIITYDEIRDPYQFLKLMEPAFGWMTDPKKIAEWRKVDSRCRSPYGFALQQGRDILGFVGVMDIPVRTLDGGIENIGGIFAVATDPTQCRAGIATRLLEHAHEHFRAKGYRFASLCTSRALVARSLYLKLGYSEVVTFRRILRAYRYYPEKKVRPSKRKKQPNLELIKAIFARNTRSRTGFAGRIDNWPQAFITQREVKPGSIIVQPDGYALFEPGSDGMFVGEMVADNAKAYRTLLKRLVKLTGRLLVMGFINDPVLVDVLRTRKFFFRTGRHFVFMVKPLGSATFEQAFGDKFYFSGPDAF
jgi:ribosomal protein S18 acetylase RimI-like enzyme